ncbi:hypothetical protein [Amycolatopsis sp. NPDC059020]|uniref:hypothetical protein n=1 Tax=unclassified Amycolatopsis TaxID=2618356 RepID=UPI00366DC341
MPEPVSGTPSAAPILANEWGVASAHVARICYHTDGAIGTAVDRMGADAHMDVDGEPLANRLGFIATKVVAGTLTAQEGLNQYKALRDRLPESSAARRILNVTLMRLDRPAPKVDLPTGTPEPLQQLARDLLTVPVVRSEPHVELQALQELAQRAAAGQLRGGHLAREVRWLTDKRHEKDGDVGKTEIDRHVRTAFTALGGR